MMSSNALALLNGGVSKPTEFRRGWRILLGATVAASLGIPSLPVYTNGVFVRPLEAEFGWARADISMGTTVSILAVAFIAPGLGILVDRVGVRRLAACGLVAIALAYFGLSRMGNHIGLYIGLQVAMNVLGVGASPLTMTHVINRWFDRAKGLALGITMAGLGVTAAFGPKLVAQMIAATGWRHAYVVLGLAPLLMAIPVWLLLAREAAGPAPREVVSRRDLPGMPVRDARRTAIFWRLVLAFTLMALAVSGFVLHLAPMLQDQGLSAADAAGTLALMGASVLTGRLATGYLVDHIFAPYVTGVIMLIASAGVAALALGGLAFAPASAIALGFALGAEVDLVGYLTARYFGLKEYGRIYGLLYCAFMTGSGLSALTIAKLASATGGYAAPLWLSAALFLTVAVLFVTAPRFPTTPGQDGPA